MNIKNIQQNYYLAVLSGFFLTMAFPKISWEGLAWIALVPLLFALKSASPSQGFRLGLTTGLVHYLTLMYWLSDTMQTYGKLPVYMAVPLVFLLAAYLAVYPALWSAALIWLAPSSRWCVIFSPILWTGLEYVRGIFFTGFPWELLGYSQYKHLHLIQISDILGVYGVSWFIVFINTAIFIGLVYLKNWKWQKNVPSRSLAINIGVCCAILAAAILTYGAWQIQQTDKKIAGAPKKQITAIQGNIDQMVKWDPAFQDDTTEKYVRLSVSTQGQKPDLVVWPETAAPFYFLLNRNLTQKVLDGVKKTQAHFLIGSPGAEQKNGAVVYYNRAYLLTPLAQIAGLYDKVHLVPFGEYVPLQKFLPFVHKIVEQIGDFRTGRKGQTLKMQNHKLGVLICYEAIFPELAKAAVQSGAGLLVNITNDAWYGLSSAPYQHFSMAVFRSVENKRALVRSANTGISGFIDPAGRILKTTALFKDATTTHLLPILSDKTFYTRFGDVFALVCLGIVVFMICINNIIKKYQ